MEWLVSSLIMSVGWAHYKVVLRCHQSGPATLEVNSQMSTKYQLGVELLSSGEDKEQQQRSGTDSIIFLDKFSGSRNIKILSIMAVWTHDSGTERKERTVLGVTIGRTIMQVKSCEMYNDVLEKGLRLIQFYG